MHLTFVPHMENQIRIIPPSGLEPESWLFAKSSSAQTLFPLVWYIQAPIAHHVMPNVVMHYYLKDLISTEKLHDLDSMLKGITVRTPNCRNYGENSCLATHISALFKQNTFSNKHFIFMKITRNNSFFLIYHLKSILTP
jgi:hypothetical protein